MPGCASGFWLTRLCSLPWNGLSAALQWIHASSACGVVVVTNSSSDRKHSVQLDSYAPTGNWNPGALTSSAAASGLSADFSIDGSYSPDLSVLNLTAIAPASPQAPPAPEAGSSRDARDESSGPTKKLSVAIPRDLHRLLKKIALDDDITMGQLITDLLTSSLRESGQLP